MDIRSVRDLQALVRARRRELGLSQETAAKRAGVSRKWLSEFERGTSGAELRLVLQMLDALDLHLDVSPEGRADAAHAVGTAYDAAVQVSNDHAAGDDLDDEDGVDLAAHLATFVLGTSQEPS
jgi:transcriptional regulator with XRE-family HTH domain